MPLDALDDAPGDVGQGAGVLFLIPGIGETLRITRPGDGAEFGGGRDRCG